MTENLKKNQNMIGHIMAFFTVFVWGTTFISTKYLLDSFTPIEILFFRFCIGFFALILVYPKRLKLTDRRQEWMFLCAGLSGVTLYFLMENIALTYTLASNVGVIVSVAPFFTAILANFFLAGEKPKATFFLGFAAAISGIALISFNGSEVLKLNPMGDILAVLAAVVWSIYSILTRKIGDFGYNTIQSTRRIFFYGLLFMLPALFFMDFNWGLERLTNPVLLLNILFLGFGASALCFVTWNFTVKVLGATRTSVYIYMVPVITVVTSAIILHEHITWLVMVGTGLTLAGLLISESKIGEKKHSLFKHN